MRKQINHARRHASFNIAELKRLGYRQVGRGAFSTVLYHPDAPDVVIKIGKRLSPRLSYADGFPYLAQKILDREISSKFYPKIYDLRWSPSGEHFLCIMKRYRKNRKHSVTKNIEKTFITIHIGHEPSWHSGTVDSRFKRALQPFTDPRIFVNDIHRGNVMFDPATNTPILTDPVCISWHHRHITEPAYV